MAIDLSKVDISKVNPAKLNLGTDMQDCALITNVFERGAHATPTEAATFATLNRSLENMKSFSVAAADAMISYLRMPQDSAADTVKQASSFGVEFGGASGGGGGDSTVTDHTKQSFNIGTQKQTTLGDSFGETLLSFARDCIPCDLRLMAFLEIHPNVDLLGVLEADLKRRLQILSDIAGLLKNVDMYGDFCELLNLLSFMCIPDLQRIIATLMALMILEVPNFDGLIGMLQALIAPIFSPILMSLTSLLDQFTLLVTNPLDCIIDAINQQLRKLNLELDPKNPFEQLSGGLSDLNTMIAEAKQSIQNKMDFYIGQVQAMLGELGTGDTAYLQASLKKLKIVRMVGFVVAIISAISRGSFACTSAGQSPEVTELNNFFQNFLNPNSSFNLWIDQDGQLHLDDKVPNFDSVVNSPTQPSPLSDFGNVFKFEGDSLLESTVALAVEEVSTALTEPIRAVLPCKLETALTDVEKVNQWVAELNQI